MTLALCEEKYGGSGLDSASTLVLRDKKSSARRHQESVFTGCRHRANGRSPKLVAHYCLNH
ncbi:hypothetical protein E2C01_046545 [Portunus trituberculatus]|uniref:Uncharacterized protein n=1 Tax=Portunus trituberculatus TaxID=210409 RepID=A0A5B7G533_PORTR|nr:hypothetical protein [Portunus trituberculatus]